MDSVVSAVIGATAAVVLFALGRWSRNRELREAERARFHDVRRELYADYLGAAFDMWSTEFDLYVKIKTEDDLTSTRVVEALGRHNEATARHASLLRQLRLIAGQGVLDALGLSQSSGPARQFDLAGGDAREPKDQSMWAGYEPIAELQRLQEAEAAIVKAARQEFGLDS